MPPVNKCLFFALFKKIQSEKLCANSSIQFTEIIYIKVLRYFFRFSHTYSIKLVKNIAKKNIISNSKVILRGLSDIKPYTTYIKLHPILMTSVFINASNMKCFIKFLLFPMVYVAVLTLSDYSFCCKSRFISCRHSQMFQVVRLFFLCSLFSEIWAYRFLFFSCLIFLI